MPYNYLLVFFTKFKIYLYFTFESIQPPGSICLQYSIEVFNRIIAAIYKEVPYENHHFRSVGDYTFYGLNYIVPLDEIPVSCHLNPHGGQEHETWRPSYNLHVCGLRPILFHGSLPLAF